MPNVSLSLAEIDSPRRPLSSRVRGKLEAHGESILYRMAGLAMTIRSVARDPQANAATGTIRKAYLADFWRPGSLGEWLDIFAAAALWPVFMVGAAALYTSRNGARVAASEGRPRWRQFADQLSLAATRGLLPPWYYVFEFYKSATRSRLPDFLSRAETKEGVYRLLARHRGASSPLADKLGFAAVCEAAGLPTPPILAVARYGKVERGMAAALPASDLFLKPVRASGGKGAERWDWSDGTYLGGAGRRLDASALMGHVAERSRGRPIVLQPRYRNHAELSDLCNGALATVRVLTCLNEQDEPEMIGSVLRMAIGQNHIVDNLHAGGIAAAVDLASGVVGRATNLGMSVDVGWLTHHPVSGAAIEGRLVPDWDAVKDLALRAHGVFRDHLLVGWDVAPTDRGVILIEGNHGPDLDIIQRVTLSPLGSSRLGALLAHHLRRLSGGEQSARTSHEIEPAAAAA